MLDYIFYWLFQTRIQKFGRKDKLLGLLFVWKCKSHILFNIVKGYLRVGKSRAKFVIMFLSINLKVNWDTKYGEI